MLPPHHGNDAGRSCSSYDTASLIFSSISGRVIVSESSRRPLVSPLPLLRDQRHGAEDLEPRGEEAVQFDPGLACAFDPGVEGVVLWVEAGRGLGLVLFAADGLQRYLPAIEVGYVVQLPLSSSLPCA